jgi:hypothetical protein
MFLSQICHTTIPRGRLTLWACQKLTSTVCQQVPASWPGSMLCVYLNLYYQYSLSHDLWHNIDTVWVFPVFPATVVSDTLSQNTVTIVRIQEFLSICCKIDKKGPPIPWPQLQSAEFLWFSFIHIQIDSILVHVWLGVVVWTDELCDNFHCSYSMYFGINLWITITQILKSEKSITRAQQTTVHTFSRI